MKKLQYVALAAVALVAACDRATAPQARDAVETAQRKILEKAATGS